MTLSEHRELIDALIFRFQNEEINEQEFRRALARNGYNATNIEAEVQQAKEGMK